MAVPPYAGITRTGSAVGGADLSMYERKAALSARSRASSRGYEDVVEKVSSTFLQDPSHHGPAAQHLHAARVARPG
jgi:hypothetical protein